MIVSVTWEERRLCDDGACTGLIGDDGLCRVCGRASKFWGDERRRGMQDDADDEADDEKDLSAGAPADRDDEDERALCPDGACTGLLDVDGRCKVCGKIDESQRVRSVRSSISATSPSGDDDGDEGDDDADADGDEGDDGDDGDDGERRLCPDGACTGLIGSDGACRVCGRRLEE